MDRYNRHKPLSLPVHGIRFTVVTELNDNRSEATFTVIRSRALELMRLLADVDFQKLTIAPVVYEFKMLEDFMSLAGPLSPVGLAADTSADVPYVSLWNQEGGHVQQITTPKRYLHDLLMLVKDGEKEDEKALDRFMLVEKVGNELKHAFDKLIIWPKDQSEKDEMPSAVEDRVKTFSEMFDTVDIDQSGEIVLEELRIVLKQKGYSDDFVEHIFCHLDMNKDYRIKREEFYEALKFIPSDIFCSDRALSDDHLLRYFDDFDTEKKGEVSWAQFHEALRNRGLTDSFIKTYFAQIDLDKSKAITRNEYKRCIGLRWSSS